MPEVKYQELELLKQISDAVASSKNTEALILLPKLAAKINEDIEKLKSISESLANRNIENEALRSEVKELKEELASKKSCFFCKIFNK